VDAGPAVGRSGARHGRRGPSPRPCAGGGGGRRGGSAADRPAV